MSALFRFMLDLCLLRVGPQRLPPARELLWLFVALYMTLGTMVYLSRYELRFAFGASLVETLLIAAFIQLLLRAWGRPERFTQTLTALLSAWTLLGLLVAPLIYATRDLEPGGQEALLVFVGMTLYLAWSLAVLGNILHHALEIPLYGGIGLGVIYFLLSQMVVAAVLPALN
ncbi:site-specific recombinase [Thiohalobacter thiocyanaticus]|uniref:Site-specific recombinase n=2 Tax=Thiohalobacter thiocyanaticus TaxID=585455 RepID=A0A1Z4VNU4_9GAMM|nr:site-specific recombinase [Thiohalobacter thiocyanaticus]